MGLVYNPVTGELDEVADDEIDVSNYDYGTTPNLTDAEVEAELDRFREEYKDEIPNMEGFEKEIGAANIKTVTDFLGKYGKKALDLFKDKEGNLDFTKLLAMAGGAYAASRPSGSTPTGYQGKIPKLTATSNMLTAPPVGRRPGSGGINYGGGATFRDEKGNVVSSNEKTLQQLRDAAQSNPYNRGSTYEASSGLSATSLDELLAAMRPSEAATTANTAANAAANTAAATAAASATNASGLAALTAAINAARPAATPATATTPTATRPTAAPTSGNTVELRTQLRNEYAAGPKTQDALDKLLLKYPPAVMQAEFPEFGNVGNYNNATMEAYYRQEQKTREANREAMRGSGQGIAVANPGGDVQMSSPGAPKMSAIPQSELAAARAKLSPEQAALIDWRLAQVNPMTGQRVADDYNRQGSNPYAGNAATQAQEQIDRAGGRKELLSQSGVSTAGIAPWEDPNWRAQQQAKEDAERARADQQRADYMAIPEAQRTVAGPGGATAPTAGYGNYLGTPMYEAPTATGGIMDWYNANVGRTDDRAQGDLNNFLANSGYTAKDIATALPQWSERDLELAGAPPAAPAPAPAVAPAPVTAAPAPVAAAPAPEPAPQEIYFDPYAGGFAAGGLAPKGFVVPADVVSHLGNGSSDAGLKLLASKLNAKPIKGEGDGMSDSIPTTIGGKQEARVANDEAFISPEEVKRIGGGDAEKGAKKLYAMMDRVREERTGTTEQGKQIDPNKFMPGGSVQKYQTGGTTTRTLPAGATGSESSLSNWAGDYVTGMLGQGQALANKPYEAYTGPLTAGASGLQNQAFGMAANLQTPASIGQAATTAGGIATGLANATSYTPTASPAYQQASAGNVTSSFQAPGAYQTGQFANQFKAPAVGAGTTQFTNQFKAPGAYQTGQFANQFKAPGAYQATDFDTDMFGTEQAQQYMNPYIEAALRPQLSEMQRASDIARLGDAARLTQAGAYGGSRQAIMEAEARRNLLGKQSDVLGQGYATAFDKGSQQFNTDQARRLQAQQASEASRQFGAQQGMTAAQLQAQFGLSAQQAQEASRQFGSTQATNVAQLQAQYGLSAQQAQEMARQFNQGQTMTAAQLQAQFGLSAQQAQEASRQFGAQQGLTAATTAGQQGLQAGIANQTAGLTASQMNINAALEAARQREQSRQFGSTLGLQGLQTGIQAAQAQGQLGALESQTGLAGLNALTSLGGVQRGIESEGIAADKAQFEEARLNPYKMVQFQQSLLSGLPLAAQSYNVPGQSNLQQFAGGATTIQQLLDILSGKTTAATK